MAHTPHYIAHVERTKDKTGWSIEVFDMATPRSVRVASDALPGSFDSAEAVRDAVVAWSRTVGIDLGAVGIDLGAVYVYDDDSTAGWSPRQTFEV